MGMKNYSSRNERIDAAPALRGGGTAFGEHQRLRAAIFLGSIGGFLTTLLLALLGGRLLLGSILRESCGHRYSEERQRQHDRHESLHSVSLQFPVLGMSPSYVEVPAIANLFSGERSRCENDAVGKVSQGEPFGSPREAIRTGNP